MKYGYVKVAAGMPLLQVADCKYNTRQIDQMIRKAEAQGVQLIVFPELSVTGYTCMDLFAQDCLLHEAEQALLELVRRMKKIDIVCIVGMPLVVENRLLNVAVVFHKGELLGVVPKSFLPSHREFQETRWFTSGETLQTKTARIGEITCPIATQLLFTSGEVSFGIEICEDLWMPVPPGSLLALQGADIIFNLSASNELIAKNDYLKELIKQQSARCISGYVYASAGYGESTTDLVYAGKGFIAENGTMLNESKRFALKEKMTISEIDIEHLRHERLVNTAFMKGFSFLSHDEPLRISFELPKGKDRLTRKIDPHPFVPSVDAECNRHCEEIFHIQMNALAKRLMHTHIQQAVIGVSGGLDSTLALMVTAMTFDALNLPRKQIHGVTMPGFGTSGRTYKNAVSLMQSLGVTMHEISIKAACEQHFKDIGHDGMTQDVVYENTQARERTQILMDLANMKKALVIGTGDLSELALGWATYNGDHMSMYAVNIGIPKTLVYYLVKWIALNRMPDEISRTTLLDIVDTPVSPELLPTDADGTIQQITENVVGPYELHDFFIYHFIRFGSSPEKIFYLAKQAFEKKYSSEEIKKWLQTFLRRFFSQQFKRSCLPDGPKVGSVSLSPRGDWRMPSDACVTLWLEEAEKL